MFWCTSKPEPNPSKKFPLPSLLLTYMDGEKCLMTDWKILYKASYYKRTEHGLGVVMDLTPTVIEQELDRLLLQSVSGRSMEIQNKDLKEILFQFGSPSGSMSIDIEQIFIVLKSGEILEVDKLGQNPLAPDRSYTWDLNGLSPQKVVIKGSPISDDCFGHGLGEISLSEPFIHPMHQPIRLEFLN